MTVDIKKFIKHLRDYVLPGFGAGRCAEKVRKALEAGGAYIAKPYPAAGKDFGPALLRIGFHEIEVKVEDLEKFEFKKGDTMVMQPYLNGNGYGHVAAYDGETWISDFIQRDFWAGPEYRKQRPSYVVYRY